MTIKKQFIVILISVYACIASSPYVPVDHWIYEPLNELHLSNRIPCLNYACRPFSREEIYNCLNAIREDDLSLREKHLIVLLLNTLKPDTNRIGFGFDFEGGDELTYYDTAATNWFGHAGVTVSAPHLSGTIRASGEEWYKETSQTIYPWKQDRAMAVRFSDNYVKTDFKHLSLAVGRCARIWGPFGNTSLVLSDNPFSFDHFFVQFRLSPFSLSQVSARLENAGGNQRYFTSHRIDLQLFKYLNVGFFESIMYVGPNRDYDIKYINPFGIYFFEQMNNQSIGSEDGNSLMGFDIEFLGDKLNARGQLLIDDIQVDNDDPGDQEPSQVGGIAGVDLFGPAPLLSKSRYLSLAFTKVTNRVYNAHSPAERYTYHSSGLALGANDFEELNINFSFFAMPQLLSQVKFSLLRQGEGGLYKYWGDLIPGGNLGFRSEQSPSGTVYTRLECVAAGKYRASPLLGVSGELGYASENNISNMDGQTNSGLLVKFKIEVSLSRQVSPINNMVNDKKD